MTSKANLKLSWSVSRPVDTNTGRLEANDQITFRLTNGKLPYKYQTMKGIKCIYAQTYSDDDIKKDMDNIIYTGSITKRHHAKIVYYLVTACNLTISESKELWNQMVKRQGLPPFHTTVTYFVPTGSKFCECGHFLYEHTQSPERNKFDQLRTGCLRCGCSEFRQINR